MNQGMLKSQNDSLKKVIDWANSEGNIRTVILTGSGARENDMDELSDLDIELYVKNPTVLLNGSGWYSQFGDVLAVEALTNPSWHPTRLVYYIKGKIDFMIAPENAISSATYTRPFRVLTDKDGITKDLKQVPDKEDEFPTQAEFDECNNWFWAAALMCAKCVVRNEPWLAKTRDWDAKSDLIRMIGWDHKARYGKGFDTWQGYPGRHIDSWMDADIRGRLNGIWTGFPVAQTAKGLSDMMGLFEEVGTRTAKNLNIADFDHQKARSEVTRILALTKKG